MALLFTSEIKEIQAMAGQRKLAIPADAPNTTRLRLQRYRATGQPHMSVLSVISAAAELLRKSARAA
jgi:hypothetical protein